MAGWTTQLGQARTLTAWAKQLGLDEDAGTLHAILDEEKAADGTLTRLAKGDVNPQAT